MKIGIYPGSFDPFHVGHENIYIKSLQLFDKVWICRGKNSSKNIDLDSDFHTPIGSLSHTFNDDLLTEIYRIAKTEKTSIENIFVIRGIRNSKDYEYQSEQDYWLKREDVDFKSVYIECDELFRKISSSAIKELIKLNMDYKNLLI